MNSIDERALKLAANLKTRGISLLDIEPATEKTDAVIYLTPSIHVQISAAWFTVVRVNNDRYYFQQPVTTTQGVAQEIEKARMREAIAMQ